VYPVRLYYQLEQEPFQHRGQHLLNKAQKAIKQSTPLSKDTCTCSPFWKRTPAWFDGRKIPDTNRTFTYRNRNLTIVE
jgi:hypothetical protein